MELEKKIDSQLSATGNSDEKIATETSLDDVSPELADYVRKGFSEKIEANK